MWVYKIKSGEMSRAGVLLARGYSGNGEGLNNPDMCHAKAMGPLPVGEYTIGPCYDSKRVGPYAIILTPAATNTMYGRSDFRIHGDNGLLNNTASKGCIILKRSDRVAIKNSKDNVLRVVAE